jgi:hypothetical protein
VSLISRCPVTAFPEGRGEEGLLSPANLSERPIGSVPSDRTWGNVKRLATHFLAEDQPDEMPTISRLLCDSVTARTPAGDLVVLHVPSGTYLKLDRNATAVFELLAEYEDVARAAGALAGHFSIPLERAEADVVSVVDKLTNLHASRTSRVRRPTLTGAMQIARQWWSLPTPLKVAVVKAVPVVMVVEAGLRTMNIGKLSEIMRVPLASGVIAPLDEDVDDVSVLSPEERRAYWATGWVLSRWIFQGTCLRQALVVGFILRRHHPILRLGLIGEGDSAHAWVEARGRAFNASAVSGTFATPRRTTK